MAHLSSLPESRLSVLPLPSVTLSYLSLFDSVFAHLFVYPSCVIAIVCCSIIPLCSLIWMIVFVRQ